MVCSGGSSVLIAVSPPPHVTILLLASSSRRGWILGCVSSVGVSRAALCECACTFVWRADGLTALGVEVLGHRGGTHSASGGEATRFPKSLPPSSLGPARALTLPLMTGVAFPLCICHSKLP